jgi:hypothetical protein
MVIYDIYADTGGRDAMKRKYLEPHRLLHINIEESMTLELEDLSQAYKTPVSAVVRECIRHGLKALKDQERYEQRPTAAK